MATMATRLHNVTEGWTKWQIALAVGAPVALGLAGLWYYKRSKSSYGDDSNKNDKVKDKPTPEKVLVSVGCLMMIFTFILVS